MYTQSGRSCTLKVIFAILTGYQRQPRRLMVKQDTLAISYLSVISSKRSVEQLGQLGRFHGVLEWHQYDCSVGHKETLAKVSPQSI